jgi:FlaG/FlaF family flagellin (archaellin)
MKKKKSESTIVAVYITHAGSNPIEVELEPDQTVKLDDGETFVIPHEAIFLKGGRAHAILVQGRGEALPIWGDYEGMGTIEVDALANNGLWRQVTEEANRKKKQAMSILSLSLAVFLLVAITVGMGVKSSGDIEERIDALEQRFIDVGQLPPRGFDPNNPNQGVEVIDGPRSSGG